MTFGEKLRQLRLSRGFSQDEMARRADLSSTYVGQVERGAYNPPKMSTLQRLIAALALNTSEQEVLISLSGRSSQQEYVIQERRDIDHLSQVLENTVICYKDGDTGKAIACLAEALKIVAQHPIGLPRQRLSS